MSLKECIEEIDLLHSKDPQMEEDVASELLYAQRMTEWLLKLNTNPSEELQIAVRSQHLCRWEIPRSDYPMNKPGYFKWRTGLAQLHADRAAECMKKSGYSEDAIGRVKTIILKKNIKADPEVQTMEDCACLVFIETGFLAFAEKYQDDKVIDIVQKTWKKMSDEGHKAALSLDLPAKALDLIKKALS